MKHFMAGALYCIGVLVLADLLRTIHYIWNERASRAKNVPHKLS